MALLGFDAIGRLALGQVRQNGQQTVTLAADPGALALTPKAVPFAVFEAAPYTVLSLSPVNVASEVFDKAEIGSMSLGPVALLFKVLEAAPRGILTASGSLSFEVFQNVAAGRLSLTPVDAPMSRTGGDFDQVYGGIGHFKEELERARQLARITRKIPAPIDRRTTPRFDPLRASPVAPAAPAVDVAALQNQRMAEAAAASAAAARRRRRDEEALLLLAS